MLALENVERRKASETGTSTSLNQGMGSQRFCETLAAMYEIVMYEIVFERCCVLALRRRCGGGNGTRVEPSLAAHGGALKRVLRATLCVSVRRKVADEDLSRFT